jgi:hypothetical protein
LKFGIVNNHRESRQLYNLTKDESTVLVHEGADKTVQWSLIRLKKPADLRSTGQ